jgi:hypothetical protein
MKKLLLMIVMLAPLCMFAQDPGKKNIKPSARDNVTALRQAMTEYKSCVISDKEEQEKSIIRIEQLIVDIQEVENYLNPSDLEYLYEAKAFVYDNWMSSQSKAGFDVETFRSVLNSYTDCSGCLDEDLADKAKWLIAEKASLVKEFSDKELDVVAQLLYYKTAEAEGMRFDNNYKKIDVAFDGLAMLITLFDNRERLTGVGIDVGTLIGFGERLYNESELTVPVTRGIKTSKSKYSLELVRKLDQFRVFQKALIK